MINTKLVKSDEAYFLKQDAKSFETLVGEQFNIVGVDVESYGRDDKYKRVFLFVVIGGVIECYQSNWTNIVKDALAIQQVFSGALLKDGQPATLDHGFDANGYEYYKLVAVKPVAKTKTK